MNMNFKQYLESEITQNHGIKVNVTIKTPSQEHGLQAVDFISWAISRKYEHQDEEYYQIIRDMNVEENPIFKP